MEEHNYYINTDTIGDDVFQNVSRIELTCTYNLPGHSVKTVPNALVSAIKIAI